MLASSLLIFIGEVAMKTRSFRFFIIIGCFLSHSANKFSSSFQGLCLAARPSRSLVLGIEAGKLKYILNTTLILLYALLHTADGIVTYLGLKFDLVDEANPLLVFFAGTMGLGLSIFLFKLLFLELIAVLYFARHRMGSCWGTATLLSADAFYSWVVSNNILLVVTA